MSIGKASRTITNSGLTAIGFYANLMVTGIPDYAGDGTAMYAISTSSTAPADGWQNSSGFVNLDKGNYNVYFYVSEGENYQKTNIVKIGTPVTINGISTSIFQSEVTTGDFKTVRYQLYSHTRDKAGAGSGGSWVYAKLNFVTVLPEMMYI